MITRLQLARFFFVLILDALFYWHLQRAKLLELHIQTVTSKRVHMNELLLPISPFLSCEIISLTSKFPISFKRSDYDCMLFPMPAIISDKYLIF